MVGYVDLAAQNTSLEDELVAALRRVITGGQVILGEEVARFEDRVAAMHGVDWAVGVGSGTDALVLALQTLGIGPGDEVITVPNSFVATVAAVVRVGATPVLVDVDEHQLLDASRLGVAVTQRTRAILPVHLNGRPAAMDAIAAVAGKAGVAVIEDCAQAVGAAWDGTPVGALGELGCFSLHPLKPLGALGDAGVIVGRAPEHRDGLRLLRNHGLRDRDTCVRWGHNSRLDTVQAAFLNVKLDQLPGWTRRRQEIASWYLAELADLPITLPSVRAREHAVWSGFVIQADARDELRTALATAGIATLVYYPIPIHLQPAAGHLGYGPGSFPVAEKQAQRILSLPIHVGLTDGEVEMVTEALHAHYGSRRSSSTPEEL